MGDFPKQKIFRHILMGTNNKEILSFRNLIPGYTSGRNKTALLPPSSAAAVNGELIAVIGRNGIGKSTLLRTLAGLQPSLGGEIFYNGRNIRDYSRMELAQTAGYISTESVKVSNMSVYELVALGRFPHTNWIGRIGTEDEEVIADSLKKTSLLKLRHKLVSELSDGERQKAMIARLLCQDTGIMIMDEPTAFLDVASKYEILHLLHLLSRNNNKTIIFSTHDLQMAIGQADKIWLILEDRLTEGAPEDLMLADAFDNLFSSSSIVFNSHDGSFSFPSDERNSIYIEGEGKEKFWTLKALARAGFKEAKEKSMPFIKLPSESSGYWQLISEPDAKQFSSLYELISYMNELLLRSTYSTSGNYQ